MKAVILIILSLSWLSACRKDEDVVVDASGVATRLPHLWGALISNNGALSWVVTNALVIYNDKNVIVGGNKDDRRQLISLDSQTGKINWAWSDLLSLLSAPTYLDPIAVDEGKYHLHQNKWVFMSGSSTYCIDLDKGITFWKHKIKLDRFDDCGGIDNSFFNSGSSEESISVGQQLYAGQVVGKTLEVPVLRPVYDRVDIDPSGQLNGRIRKILPLVVSKDTLLAILFSDPAKMGNRFPTNMGLYNLSQRKWVYERTPLNGSYPNSNVSWAKLYNGKVYHTSTRSMLCHDVMTGKEIWSANFDQGFASSGFTIQEGKIFANNGDRYTYCLNPETGRQIWKEESSGSASPISYLNGVLYFMGGGDGRLHAIDANTGKHLWRLRSPDVDKNSGAFFYGTCVAVPGQGGKKGRVVATTGLNAYGYEAIR